MLKKAETYEEAVKIIKYSVDDKITKKTVNTVMLLRGSFITAIAAAAFSTVGLGNYFLIPIGVVAGMNLIPYMQYLNNRRKIKDDSYFNGKSESEIVKEANDYVDWRNERKSEGKTK